MCWFSVVVLECDAWLLRILFPQLNFSYGFRTVSFASICVYHISIYAYYAYHNSTLNLPLDALTACSCSMYKKIDSAAIREYFMSTNAIFKIDSNDRFPFKWISLDCEAKTVTHRPTCLRISPSAVINSFSFHFKWKLIETNVGNHKKVIKIWKPHKWRWWLNDVNMQIEIGWTCMWIAVGIEAEQITSRKRRENVA